MIETLLGGLLGGVFRIIPEILKFFDAKNDRVHELKMQAVEYRFRELAGKQRIAELSEGERRDWNTGALDALQASIQAQGKPSGVRWIDGFSSLMRPLITFQWVILLYPAVIVATFVLYIAGGQPPLEALIAVFGPEEKALVAGVLNFWFLGRVFDRVR